MSSSWRSSQFDSEEQEPLGPQLKSQSGYESMGQVYRDPETGKLILISNE
ncbi:hypothetical protein ACXJY6_03010 [Vibrio sp. RC27]